MSYDLMVFNPKNAPKSETDFMNWYENQTEWEEEHDYDDPKVSSEELRNWFMEMINDFPALNGPYAPDDIDVRIDDDELTDYCVGKDVIYSAFRFSVAEKAYPKMIELAEKHKVGFFDASGNGNIMFPNGNGILESINKKMESKPWWKFW
ncbi:hypothetical protein MY04_4334 [Flammeovirga sp. MY04]|uniref:hypothetical protein n=1 Tax=Flammeovirga sp. MY04 TaxID=1191459 RepID=UPI000806254C|nr:hypothetical protein [Flammeovirga sp. MY04]ANQ51674.1 hypothetical protein MY04_4334 [Flammeovirga sp. MY04]